MVKGLDKFREAFAAYPANYVIIGGTACDVVLAGTDMRPRATDDIDMILVVENMTEGFGKAFWQLIKEGGYGNGKRKRGEDKSPAYELYRFSDGKEGYPVQIELLSRHSELLQAPSGFHIEPLPIGEDVSSLSAIMMDDDYYELTVKESFMDNGLRFASPKALICLKVKAYLNLLAEKEAGRLVNSKDIKKHRNDVLKLIAVTPLGEPSAIPQTIHESILAYVGKMRSLLPDQSLEDALQRSSDEISAYLDALTEMFTPQKK